MANPALQELIKKSAAKVGVSQPTSTSSTSGTSSEKIEETVTVTTNDSTSISGSAKSGMGA